MTQGISAAKKRLRAEIRLARASRRPDHAGFVDNLSPELVDAKVIAGYLAYGTEPVITDALLTAIATGKEVLLPILQPDGDLKWGSWQGEALEKSGQLAQPRVGTLEAITTADIIIVPALAVDRFGHRLGQGGGSYDRALSRNRSARVIAVIFDEELVDSVPVDDHDINVTAAVTQDRVINF